MFSEGYEMTAQREKRTYRKLGEVSVLPQVDRQQRGKWSSRRQQGERGRHSLTVFSRVGCCEAFANFDAQKEHRYHMKMFRGNYL